MLISVPIPCNKTLNLWFTKRHVHTLDGHIVLKFHSPVAPLLFSVSLVCCLLLSLLRFNLRQVDGAVVQCSCHFPWVRLVVRAAQHLGHHPTPGDKIGKYVVWSVKWVKQNKELKVLKMDSIAPFHYGNWRAKGHMM